MEVDMLKPKVCMLLCYLPFLDSRIFECEAKSLLNNGYDVTIIAPRKAGLLFDINGAPFNKKFRERVFYYQGIKVVTYDSERRSLNPVSDPLYQLGIKEDADFYHAHELNSFTYGKAIKQDLQQQRNKEVKLIYDSRQLIPDPFPLQINDHTKQQWHKTLLGNLQEADYVITVSNSIKSWYLAMDPMLSVEVIYNAPPLSKHIMNKNTPNDSFVVVHEGNMSRETFEKVIAITEGSNSGTDVEFKIIGGSRYGETFPVPAHLQNRVHIEQWVDYHTLPATMAGADLGLIDLDPTHSLNNMFAMPAKLFSYLNNGIPVVASKCSDIEKFIKTYQCGLVINKRNPAPADYLQVIHHLRQHPEKWAAMGSNARKVMEEVYNWNHMEKRLISIYQSLGSNQMPYLLS